MLFIRVKSLTALCGLLLLQACTSTPTAITYSDRIKLVGGSAPQAEEIALIECGKLNPFFFTINLVDEHPNIHGRVRDYKCQLWESSEDLTRPTSLEQKVLQTRKFSNSPTEIENALNAWVRKLQSIKYTLQRPTTNSNQPGHNPKKSGFCGH